MVDLNSLRSQSDTFLYSVNGIVSVTLKNFVKSLQSMLRSNGNDLEVYHIDFAKLNRRINKFRDSLPHWADFGGLSTSSTPSSPRPVPKSSFLSNQKHGPGANPDTVASYKPDTNQLILFPLMSEQGFGTKENPGLLNDLGKGYLIHSYVHFLLTANNSLKLFVAIFDGLVDARFFLYLKSQKGIRALDEGLSDYVANSLVEKLPLYYLEEVKLVRNLLEGKVF